MAEEIKVEEIKKLTKTEVKELGFTDKMIKTLLPEPERKKSPRGWTYPDTLLWEEKTVLEVMNSEEFREMNKIAQKRREAARKANDTKYDKTMASIQEAIKDIEILEKPLDQIYEEAIESKFEYDNAIGKNEYHSLLEYQSVDQATKDRWAVNYIRHEISDYDYVLSKIKGKVGVRTAYEDYYDKLADEIAKKYPALAGEVYSQFERKKEQMLNKLIWS